MLRDSIVNGTITAGARITEIQISQQLNLSRAIIRTALHQLAKEGLLNLVPYTGWTVLSLSSRDVWELYTLRSAVERLAAQFVAGSINSSESLRLKWAFDGLAKECKRGSPPPDRRGRLCPTQDNHPDVRSQAAWLPIRPNQTADQDVYPLKRRADL